MLRIIVIVLLSFCSLFPLLAFTTQQFGLSDDVGAVISVVLGWVILPAALLKFWKVKPGLEVLAVDIDDPVMQEHISLSKSKLDDFFKGLSAGKLEAYIKFPYEFEGEVEHVWGLAHSKQEKLIVASLASDPVGEADEDIMGRIKISIESIEDWMLVDSMGITRGGYSMLAMAKIYERDYGKLPKPYAKDLERFTDFSWPENA